MTKAQAKQRLEYLRGEIEAERISYGEIAELQSLTKYIEPGDVLLLQWAGVPENEEEKLAKLFEIRDFDTTKIKHGRRIELMHEKMNAQGYCYADILDENAWQVVDTNVEDRLQRLESLKVKTSQRQIAHMINDETRQVIINSLEYLELPKSYDTAFFIDNYDRVIASMVEILQNINARRGNHE